MHKKGYTLVELLVVVTIIGLLAAISMATYSATLKKSRDSKRKQAVNTMSRLMSTAMSTSDQAWPTTAAGVEAILFGQGAYPLPVVADAKYHYYYYTDENRNFVIYACLEEDTTPRIVMDGTAQGLVAITDGVNDPVCDDSGTTAGTDGTTVQLTS